MVDRVSVVTALDGEVRLNTTVGLYVNLGAAR
jgi:hypothetical protein